MMTILIACHLVVIHKHINYKINILQYYIIFAVNVSIYLQSIEYVFQNKQYTVNCVKNLKTFPFATSQSNSRVERSKGLFIRLNYD